MRAAMCNSVPTCPRDGARNSGEGGGLVQRGTKRGVKQVFAFTLEPLGIPPSPLRGWNCNVILGKCSPPIVRETLFMVTDSESLSREQPNGHHMT